MIKPFTINRKLIVLFGVIFIVSRILFLDRDVPPWDVSFYSAFDEFYYTIAGFNMYRFGDPNFDLTSYLQTENLYGHNFIQNLFTWISYEIFGNNYYGLRMASVLASLLSLIFFIIIIKQIFHLNGNRNSSYKLLYWFVLFYFLIDYNFTIAGRIAEPTIFRIASVLFLMWVFLKIKKHNLFNILTLGFISGCMVLMIYLNNLFVIPSVLLLLLIYQERSLKNYIRVIILFLSGVLISVLFYYVLYKALFNNNPFQSIYATVFNYQDRVNLFYFESILNIFKSFAGNSIKFTSTNIFRHNILLLIIFLSVIPVYIYRVRKYKLAYDLVIASFYLFLFLQSLAINDYFFRKQLIQLPLVLLIITTSIFSLKEFYSHIKNSKYFNYYKIYLVFTCLGSLLILVYSSRIYTFYDNPIVFINVALLILSVLIAILMSYGKLKLHTGILLVFIFLAAPNIFLNLKYNYIKPEYKHRDAMIESAHFLNGKIIAGGPSHALRMYNTGIPVFDFWQFENNHTLYREKFFRLLSEKKIDLSFAFVNKNGVIYPSQFLDLVITEHGFIKITELDINLDLLLPEKDVRLGIFKSPE